jgi:hypothetical protein
MLLFGTIQYYTRAEHSRQATRSCKNLAFSNPHDTFRIHSTAQLLFFPAVRRDFFLPRNVSINHGGTRSFSFWPRSLVCITGILCEHIQASADLTRTGGGLCHSQRH